MVFMKNVCACRDADLSRLGENDNYNDTPNYRVSEKQCNIWFCVLGDYDMHADQFILFKYQSNFTVK